MRAETQILKDGEHEMMHSVAFAVWASKPENEPPRGLTTQEAGVEFLRKCEAPGAITDEDGKYRSAAEDFRTRVAVKTRTLSTNRQVMIKSQGLVLKVLRPKMIQAYIDTYKHR